MPTMMSAMKKAPLRTRFAAVWVIGLGAFLPGLLVVGLLIHPAFQALAASSETFALTGSLNTARYQHTATLLPDGEVLVTGGLDVNGNPLASAELYNPATGKWSVTGGISEARVERAHPSRPSPGLPVPGR